jgi:preprotein translocase subunit SecG
VLRTAVLTLSFFVLLAPVALASNHDGGEGWWGETNDKVITNAGFILIAAFPTLVLVLSLIQWRLDKRKDRRLAAERARKARADMRGGW